MNLHLMEGVRSALDINERELQPRLEPEVGAVLHVLRRELADTAIAADLRQESGAAEKRGASMTTASVLSGGRLGAVQAEMMQTWAGPMPPAAGGADVEASWRVVPRR